LNHVQDWSKLARQANWSVSKLAREHNVSVRTLHRHFLKYIGRSTKLWLAEQRQQYALELMRHGYSIKETASRLGYKQSTNFTRQFKSHWGTCPSRNPPPLSHRNENVRK